MAFGGGNFTGENKVLPGTYINFVSAVLAGTVMSERGNAAMPLEMDWGPAETVFSLDAETFRENSEAWFGYGANHEKMKGIRDLFCNARTLYGYRVNGKGVCAACDYGTARYPGLRGNDLKMVISLDGDQYTVRTILDGRQVDVQKAADMAGLQDNGYVVFKRDAALQETAGVPFTGGTNSEAEVEDYQKFCDRISSYPIHAVGVAADSVEVKELFETFTRQMRDELGVKFQTVLFRHAADYEGIVSLENGVASPGDGAERGSVDCSLVYWVTGAIAGCKVQASNTNKKYDGEFLPDTDYPQRELEDAVMAGKFMFHQVGDEVRVLEDINTLITYTEEKQRDFSSNQTIRVLDQIGNDIAALFGRKYLGRVPNDEAGRVSLWSDVVAYYRELETMRAIENFQPDQIAIKPGTTKKSVIASCPVTPVNAMAQLYMTVVVA